MKTTLVFLTALFSLQAHAGDTVYCTGTRTVMQDHDIISADDEASTPACSVPDTLLTRDAIKKYCVSTPQEDECSFIGHVVRRDGNLSYVDRIVGPINEDDQSAKPRK